VYASTKVGGAVLVDLEGRVVVGVAPSFSQGDMGVTMGGVTMVWPEQRAKDMMDL
jgi:hypothetical protein